MSMSLFLPLKYCTSVLPTAKCSALNKCFHSCHQHEHGVEARENVMAHTKNSYLFIVETKLYFCILLDWVSWIFNFYGHFSGAQVCFWCYITMQGYYLHLKFGNSWSCSTETSEGSHQPGEDPIKDWFLLRLWPFCTILNILSFNQFRKPKVIRCKVTWDLTAPPVPPHLQDK